MKNSMCRSFTHNLRHGIMESLKERSSFIWILVNVPGVGSYRLQSEFGYYEAKKWIKL